jgi:hypothetical protein
MKLTTKKLKKLIQEELNEMRHEQQRFDQADMPTSPYRFDDEDKVERVYGSSEFKDHSVHGSAVSDLMRMLGVNPGKLIDLRNRLQGMQLDQKGEGVLAYLEDITKGMDDY